MQIKFSRHAKRRAKLYNISENIIITLLRDTELTDGEHQIIKNIKGFKYPLKIVVAVEGKTITVVTNYPLKKGRKR